MKLLQKLWDLRPNTKVNVGKSNNDAQSWETKEVKNRPPVENLSPKGFARSKG